MLRNALAITTFFWLSLAPTLCTAGLLAHACDVLVFSGCDDCCEDDDLHDDHGCCAEEDHSPRACHSCSDSHDACSHDACADDPCQLAVMVQQHRHEKLSSDGDSLANAPLPFSDPGFSTQPITWQPFERSFSHPTLPYFSSDRPLRS
ncbi:MAG: hypothetical protein HN891_02025 [Planctomycetes bacterium]|nr:hypothetical protein [Planctomycetota bacterium]MBT6451578.1 hypothetical protein [Planctomycetota bacterium]MBT6540680.1 hypothetical protein [Planctomycetota bacterium]MBT6784016.1 hypothetical protein [Planctomycetota bacterium]MBT6967759.1 hypothetical protein [Planctomycetota bacterium]